MKNIKEYVNEQKAILKSKILNCDRPPIFYIIQVGDDEASNRYVRNKIKDCEEVGIQSHLIKYDDTYTEEILQQMNALNNDNKVNAYMVQFPLPKHINKYAIIKNISPRKDADGFTENGITNPATPQGIITYLERNDYDFENKNALIIGRSEIVGKPMARLLLDKNCNVTILHSHTSEHNKFKQIELADLIVCATGDIGTLHHDYQYYSPIIFDVGINFDDNGKLVGDCYPNLKRVAFQSPVPGGVGLLTRLQLLENIYKLYLMNGDKNQND